MRITWIALSLLLSCVAFAEQQKNEVGFTLGAEFVPDRTAGGNPVSVGDGIIYGANYARHLAGDRTRLYLELPFAAAPSHHVRTADSNFITNLATLYFTPSLRVKFASGRGLSPWISGGFGYGLYEGNQLLANGDPNPHRLNSTGTAQFGGGVDVRTGLKVLFPLSLRGEVRDFYTVANPEYGRSVSGDGQHNIVVSGGFVIHF